MKNLIEEGNYDAILVYDQLNQNFRAERVFEKYKEGRITFRPTYKYDTGSDEWDSRCVNVNDSALAYEPF